MNAAIILAVSDYENTNCLPGCILDAQLIQTLLDKTGKYSESLVINQNTDSIQVKDELSQFILSNKNKIFDEVFFYYTGHGDFRDNEFYFILSDFEKSRYRQTSLANSELDNLLKQLNPKLTVKIVDACHSGVTYIKDNDIFNKHLDESKNKFKNCYFMFSSMSDQSSYQSKTISHFTKSFIDSVIKYEANDIRYKHIIDYISDEFEKNSLQSPFFVNQAEFTEIFCSVTKEIKQILSTNMKEYLKKSESTNNEGKTLSLGDLVKRDAKKYCSKDEVLGCLNFIKEFVSNYSYSSDLKQLYTISTELKSDYKSISQFYSSIGKWIKNNENMYFAKVIEVEKPIDDYSTIYALANVTSILSGKSRYRTVVSGYELTIEVPFKLIQINTKPNYPNIDWNQCNIAFIFSQVSIRFFYFYSNYKLKDWDNYIRDSSSEWQTVEVEIKNVERLKETISEILSKLDSFAIDPLKAKYVLTVESSSDS